MTGMISLLILLYLKCGYCDYFLLFYYYTCDMFCFHLDVRPIHSSIANPHSYNFIAQNPICYEFM